jgi:iron complex outermembrane receptor protein
MAQPSPPLALLSVILSLGLAGCATTPEIPHEQASAVEEQRPAASPDHRCPPVNKDRSNVEPCVSVSSRDPNTPVRDTPGSTQIINRQLIEDQRALTVGDALRNVSGVQGR